MWEAAHIQTAALGGSSDILQRHSSRNSKNSQHQWMQDLWSCCQIRFHIKYSHNFLFWIKRKCVFYDCISSFTCLTGHSARYFDQGAQTFSYPNPGSITYYYWFWYWLVSFSKVVLRQWWQRGDDYGLVLDWISQPWRRVIVNCLLIARFISLCCLFSVVPQQPELLVILQRLYVSKNSTGLVTLGRLITCTVRVFKWKTW